MQNHRTKIDKFIIFIATTIYFDQEFKDVSRCEYIFFRNSSLHFSYVQGAELFFKKKVFRYKLTY